MLQARGARAVTELNYGMADETNNLVREYLRAILIRKAEPIIVMIATATLANLIVLTIAWH
jgi:hypothetical protein